MSSVTRVPQTRTMDGEELSADDARTTLRHYGRLKLVKDAFVRFRYGDGFSHSRALALQLVLSLIPLGIAFIGLSSTVKAEQVGLVLREVLLRITPGSTDDVVKETLKQGHEQAARAARSRSGSASPLPWSRSRRRWARSSAVPTASTASSATGRRPRSTRARW